MLLVSPLIFFFSIKEQNRCVVTVWILKFPLLYLLLFYAPIDPIRILSFPIYVFLGRARRTVAARPLTIGLSTYCGTVCTTVTIATIGTIWHCAWKMYGKPTCLHTPILILPQKRLSFFIYPMNFIPSAFDTPAPSSAKCQVLQRVLRGALLWRKEKWMQFMKTIPQFT